MNAKVLESQSRGNHTHPSESRWGIYIHRIFSKRDGSPHPWPDWVVQTMITSSALASLQCHSHSSERINTYAFESPLLAGWGQACVPYPSLTLCVLLNTCLRIIMSWRKQSVSISFSKCQKNLLFSLEAFILQNNPANCVEFLRPSPQFIP